MDEVSVLDPAPFPVQNLQNLEILKNYHEGFVKHLDEQESKLEELRELKKKLSKLQKKRSALKSEIKQMKKKPKTLRDVLLEQSEETTELNNEIPKEVYELVAEFIEENNKSIQFIETSIAYRLAGRTLFALNKELIVVRFETFFKGKYFESYYVMLGFDKNSNKLIIRKHTIPFFIPMDDLISKYLHGNIREEFMDRICDYLHAFVARREQLSQLKQEKKLEDILSSISFDLMQFKYRLEEEDSTLISFTLSYENLLESLPSKVTIQSVSQRSKVPQRKAEAEFNFTQNRLLSAFNKSFP